MASDKKHLEDFLSDHPSVDFIRIQWVDFSGVLHVCFVSVPCCLDIADGKDLARLTQSSLLAPISTAPKSFSLSNRHETWTLCLDWHSIRPCGFQADHATVMGFLDQMGAPSRFDKCPRMLLSNAVDHIELDWGTKISIGFKIQFALLDESDDLVQPMDRILGSSLTAGLRGETLDLVEKIVAALHGASITVDYFRASARDQIEISLSLKPAIQAVDDLVLAQETIRTICVRNGLKATMSPKPTVSGPLNGLHLHLSVSNTDSGVVNNFLAGVLTHMTSLCAFGMANYDSYARATSNAAGSWIGFGTNNRDLPVRKINDRHFELTMLDGTANPYIFAAALLLAGTDGIRKKTDLVWEDCKLFLGRMNDELRAQYGINKAMPATLDEAIRYLKEDESMKVEIGEDLVAWYTAVKDKEVENFATMSGEQRRRRLLEFF